MLSAFREQARKRLPVHVVDALDKIMRTLEADGAIVKAWEEGVDLLLQNGLAWQQLAKADQVGVHPCNRGGAGLMGDEICKTGADHLKAGYSYTLASAGAFAVQMPEDPADAKRFNACLVDKLHGLLPPLSSSATLLSLGGGHTNGFLRAVLGNCKTSEKVHLLFCSICSTDAGVCVEGGGRGND